MEGPLVHEKYVSIQICGFGSREWRWRIPTTVCGLHSASLVQTLTGPVSPLTKSLSTTSASINCPGKTAWQPSWRFWSNWQVSQPLWRSSLSTLKNRTIWMQNLASKTKMFQYQLWWSRRRLERGYWRWRNDMQGTSRLTFRGRKVKRGRWSWRQERKKKIKERWTTTDLRIWSWKSMNHVSRDMTELNYMYMYVIMYMSMYCTIMFTVLYVYLYIHTHAKSLQCSWWYAHTPCTPLCTYVCTCTCACVVKCLQMQVCNYGAIINCKFLFVAVFAGPEAIQRAHPTREQHPSAPTVVKNGQLTLYTSTCTLESLWFRTPWNEDTSLNSFCRHAFNPLNDYYPGTICTCTCATPITWGVGIWVSIHGRTCV